MAFVMLHETNHKGSCFTFYLSPDEADVLAEVNSKALD